MKGSTCNSCNHGEIQKRCYGCSQGAGWSGWEPIKKEEEMAQESEQRQESATNPTPSHYNKFYKGIKIDPYRIYELYDIRNGAHQQAVKKLLRSGQAHKDLLVDIDETISALLRWKEMIQEELEDQPQALIMESEDMKELLAAELKSREAATKKAFVEANELVRKSAQPTTVVELSQAIKEDEASTLKAFILRTVSAFSQGYHYNKLCRIASQAGYSTAGMMDILQQLVLEKQIFKTPGSRYTSQEYQRVVDCNQD